MYGPLDINTFLSTDYLTKTFISHRRSTAHNYLVLECVIITVIFKPLSLNVAYMIQLKNNILRYLHTL